MYCNILLHTMCAQGGTAPKLGISCAVYSRIVHNFATICLRVCSMFVISRKGSTMIHTYGNRIRYYNTCSL